QGNLVPTDEIAVYYRSEPAGDYLHAVIQRHTDFILATIKSPLKPYPVPPTTSVVIQEKTQLKGSELEITLVRVSPQAADGVDGPACAFVNVNISVSGTELSGAVLLENPKGVDAIDNLSKLKAAVCSIFHVQSPRVAVYSGKAELLDRTNPLSLSGRTLQVTSGGPPAVASDGNPLLCQYVNLRLLHTDTQGNAES
ncbi:hypothetical protein FKM82_027701, partial [Ascaphus truei]